ncbi:DUF4190 domain-containing protein [Cryobacterium sp. Sr8]|uniref:DUF4190 domain-containing protein n=1 Tax=Cryobacterium sp. Sr8 TaxID=1259203 RepID=UPI00106DAAE4|nr:DUF4190 domain-containing protein [Cryobacterium sp. Sr8]TFD75427.1 DUF4190 domain-containing protein [Cryobacterium sp. Sr8]
MDNSQQTVDTGAPTPPPAAPAPQAPAKNGLATASLVIGILAVIGAFIPFVNYGSGLLATVGAVLGLVAVIQKAKRNKTAFAGLIISVLAIILSVTMAVAYTAGFAASVADSVGSDSVAVDEPAADDDELAAEPAPEPAESGTRENPAALGTMINVEESGQPVWEITPGKSILDANSVIADANMFNDVPDAGMVWAMLPLTIKYVGTETGNPLIDISVKFVSAAGTTHEQFDKSAVTPNDLSSLNEMYPGASATGNVAVMIPIADAAAGTWAVAGSMFGEDFFFAAQ